jgi:8-amino-7-oxononanoate synthase
VTHKGSPLADEARQRLLSRVALLGDDAGARPPPTTLAKSPTDKSRVDFNTLPGFEELRIQRTIGEKIGVGTPYFRMHEARAGSRTRIDGREIVNFSSYDYLGLNADPRITAAAKEAIDHYGISPSGSRHVAGERPIHRALENALATHYGVDDCVAIVSGYATNLGVIGQLVGPKDLLICDAAVHNSAVMGGVLSGAARRSFPHNDLDALERLLVSTRHKFERALIVVEGLYSMDGDWPDLHRLIDIKTRYEAWLMVDEAHALGVLGNRGYGSFEQCGVDPGQVDIWMGTLSKTLAGCGGYIAGSADLVDYIKSLVGVFVYSVGMPPLIAATAHQAVKILRSEPERVARLHRNAELFRQLAKERGLDTGTSASTAICPTIVGDSIPAVVLSHKLLDRGFNVLPVLYPAVPAKAARLRFFLTAEHTPSEIEAALDATAAELTDMPKTLRAMRVPGY